MRGGSPRAQAGVTAGDQINPLKGRVIARLTAVGAYVGSLLPGTPMEVAYVPAGSGPQQAQRPAATIGAAGRAAPAGTSTGRKVAIGGGAAAARQMDGDGAAGGGSSLEPRATTCSAPPDRSRCSRHASDPDAASHVSRSLGWSR